MNEPTAQRVDEHARGVTASTTQFRRSNNTTRVFDRGRGFGAVGDYDLVQQLGRSVFVGQHRGSKRPFAIRLLDPPGRPELLARQLVAARALASIDHPNVVRTIEVGLHEGRVYLVMEQLRGRTLASMLELHGTPSIGQALRVGLHVARGLEAAHQRGVIHRNLDADTVFIAPNERGRSTLKLFDFELAPGDDVVRIARHSMSPEVVRGGAVDHRSDLYSLGVLLHRVCTLKYPFEGSPIEILAMYRFRSVMRPDPELAGVPSELAATIRKCLSEDPADRYRSAAEVLEALRRVAEGQGRREQPEAAERPESAERSERSAPMFLDMDQVPSEQWGSIGSTPAPAPAPISPAALASSALSLALTSPGVPAAEAKAAASAPVPVPVPSLAPSAPTLVPGPRSPAAAKAPSPASTAAAQARTVIAGPAAAGSTAAAQARTVIAGPAAAGASAAQARTVVAPLGPLLAPPPSVAPISSGVPVPVPSLAPSAPVPSFSLGAAMPPLVSGAAAPPPAAVPEPIDPASDTSGILISSSGPARVATAVSMDPRPARPARLLQRVPWKPVSVLVAAILVGSALSLWTTSGGHAPASTPAVSEAPPKPTAPAASGAPAATPGAPAMPAPAAAAPTLAAAAPAAAASAASTLPAASRLPVQSCAPNAPALVPDVVLTVGRPPPAPAAAAASAAEARGGRDEEPRKPAPRKVKPRKAKPAEGEAAAEQPAATDAPVSGETIVVPDEEPRKRARRSRVEREDRIDL